MRRGAGVDDGDDDSFSGLESANIISAKSFMLFLVVVDSSLFEVYI